jgi:hypothetical protein
VEKSGLEMLLHADFSTRPPVEDMLGITFLDGFYRATSKYIKNRENKNTKKQ